MKNLQPRVWDASSPYYLPGLTAVMVSYAEFHARPRRRRAAMEVGIRAYLGIPATVQVYLDNGAFFFRRAGGEVPRDDYAAFVQAARPDWYPVPQDYIPTPGMSDAEQLDCLRRTMAVNCAFSHDGYVPVIHVSRCLSRYLEEMRSDTQLREKPAIGLGAIVPNLLRSPKAMAYGEILAIIRLVRAELGGRQLHVFGIGGTATLHVASLLDVDSADSSGWRNRAARGIVQLPGRGDRMVARMGTWRGREPSAEEALTLAACPCPACCGAETGGLRADGLAGFCRRATHNLWVLLEEARQIEEQLAAGTYADWYGGHLENTIYLPLIRKALELRGQRDRDG